MENMELLIELKSKMTKIIFDIRLNTYVLNMHQKSYTCTGLKTDFRQYQKTKATEKQELKNWEKLCQGNVQ